MFLNESKLERARAVCSSSRKFEAESAEARALAMATEEGLKGEERVKRVYVLIGGALAGETKTETKVGPIEELSETKGKEIEEVSASGSKRKAAKKDK